jgi:hypothetical protein
VEHIDPKKVRTDDGPLQGYEASQFVESWNHYNVNGHHAESEPEAIV